MNKQIITCHQTLAVSSHRVFPADMNNYGFMFGGKLLSLLDDVASISISRFTHALSVTASVDQFNFIKPFQRDHSVCVQTYVSGVGQHSIEVFAKVIGESLLTGERYLGGTAFTTFVLQHHKTVDNQLLPKTPEEKAVVSGYAQRRIVRKQQVAEQKQLAETLSLDSPWNVGK